MGNMGKAAMAKAVRLMLLDHMNFQDALRLYNKYIGDWGGKSTVFRFEAVKNGEVVKTVTKAPASGLSLKVKTSHIQLREADTYDVAAVRIQAVDQYGNTASFANEPVMMSVSGDLQLIGPEMISLQGGMGGTYVKTVGRSGHGVLHIHTGFDDIAIDFDIVKEGANDGRQG
jgi:beta-galactosidase